MFKHILRELKSHAPFTAFGAVTGILVIIYFQKLSFKTSYDIFYILHPMHVLLSAFVTASMYKIHKDKCSLWILLAIGYTGSIGIATLSDSLTPYLAESLLNMPNRHAHIGFIEKWWLINPLAILGVAIAYFRPRTKLPHSGHVLLSTWASVFHIIMARGEPLHWFAYVSIFLFLFIAVWIPCCLSDIIFPMLFIKGDEKKHLQNH